MREVPMDRDDPLSDIDIRSSSSNVCSNADLLFLNAEDAYSSSTSYMTSDADAMSAERSIEVERRSAPSDCGMDYLDDACGTMHSFEDVSGNASDRSQFCFGTENSISFAIDEEISALSEMMIGNDDDGKIYDDYYSQRTFEDSKEPIVPSITPSLLEEKIFLSNISEDSYGYLDINDNLKISTNKSFLEEIEPKKNNYNGMDIFENSSVAAEFENDTNHQFINFEEYDQIVDIQGKELTLHMMSDSIKGCALMPLSCLSFKFDKRGEPCGILSRKTIPSEIKFGPLEGVLRSVSYENIKNYIDPCFFVEIEEDLMQIDISNETTSYWMRYIRYDPDQKCNIFVEQIGQELFFVTSCEIDQGTELILGYGASYKSRVDFIFNKKLEEKFGVGVNCNKCGNTVSNMNCFDVYRKTLMFEDFLKKKMKMGLFCEACSLYKSLEIKNELESVTSEYIVESNNEQDVTVDVTECLGNEDKIKADKDAIRRIIFQYDCDYCGKTMENYDDLDVHLETHYEAEIMKKCSECEEIINSVSDFKVHVIKHKYSTCITCSVTFNHQNELIEHIETTHQQLDENVHLTKNPDIKKSTSPLCSKQFKRRNKLIANLKGSHASTKDECIGNIKRKIDYTSNDESYLKYVFKCHTCRLGFKRRGMLVNHFARCHPEISRENVPELQLPILKTTRDYYCQYCEKIYKSSSKRKAHIIKKHPGETIPPSSRGIDLGHGEYGKVGGVGYTACVGTISIKPHHCPYDPCHKQYASKAKLLQHVRNKHSTQMNNFKENGNVFKVNDQIVLESSNLKESEENLAIEKMRVLKSKLMNVPVKNSFITKKKLPTNFGLEKGSTKNREKVDNKQNINMKNHIGALLKNKNEQFNKNSCPKKLPPVSVFTSYRKQIPLLSQYTDR